MTEPRITQPAEDVWALHTITGSYVIHLRGEDVPMLAHWGARVDDSVALEIVHGGHGHPRGWESELDGREEYPSDSGLRFVEPALALRFADGTRGVRWRFETARVLGDELILQFSEVCHPLKLELHYRVRAEVIERWTRLEAEERVEVLRADAAAWCLPLRPHYRVSSLHGRWAAETQLQQHPLPFGTTRFSSRRTTTSLSANPWLAIDAGEATETAGEVWSVALAWSGTWHLDAQRLPNGYATVAAGPGHDVRLAVLEAGESYTSAVSLGVYSAEGFGAASRAWHAHAVNQVLPHGDEVRPVLYNSWEATGFDVNEEGQVALAQVAASLGCELFVMDDGWFGARLSDHAGLGDWHPNPDRFPNGLGPLIDAVHAAGMAFGIWVEPEMVNPDSDLYRTHPDWVYGSPGLPRHELRNQLVLNLARDDVAAWMHEWLDRLLTENDIAFIKWDMNRPVSDAGWPEHPVPESAFEAHARNLYAIWDRLRHDHPGVRFESCASGGGRVDYGILARADQVWPSDNTDASDRIGIQYGFSQLYPARVMTAWVTDSPNQQTGRMLPLRFRFHVAMSGVLGIGGEITQWSEEELAEAAGLVAQYKRIRPVVQHGRLHRLASPLAGTVSSLAYLTEDAGEVVAFQYLDAHRYGEPAEPLRLPMLPAGARYQDLDRGVEHSSELLATVGVDLGLSCAYDSAIVHLRRI